MTMRKLIREFMDISATEKRGMLMIIMAIIIIQAFRLIYPMLLSDKYPITEEQALQYAEWIIKHDTALGASLIGDLESEKSDNLNGFHFDPNILDKAGWTRLGFSDREAETALKFIRKGGHFKTKSDLKKMFLSTLSNFLRWNPGSIYRSINNRKAPLPESITC
jgi:competence protein ComEA